MAESFRIYKNATDVPPQCCAVEPNPDGTGEVGSLWTGLTPPVCAQSTEYLVTVYPVQDKTLDGWKDCNVFTGACKHHVAEIRMHLQHRVIEIEMYVEPESWIPLTLRDGYDLPVREPLFTRAMLDAQVVTFSPGSIVIVTP